ncbi:hypothetical protein GALMADRAFT_108380 [Galerina marginata CBS 339.88]|uniref:F-box domain-containing protein n=1 Tax=Galerina marginata (strain CBS 339.88) TaxID=685588 RepID=A0A067TQ91_GALM3|nr:hypothetical protein GALMADRAFT_108380 [Galerina marginata CBS 339.88]
MSIVDIGHTDRGRADLSVDSDDTSSGLSSKPVAQLCILPTELYSNILEALDYQDLLTCMQVCSLFRELIRGTASLQYVIELAVAGQRDGSNCTASSATRLKLLRRHQSAWNDLKWSREVRIPMRNGGLWELYGGVLGQSTQEGTLVFSQLPSDLRSIEAKEWTLGPDFGITISDFAMDPMQDLLILIESPNWSLSDANLKYQIHLRSLSTGKPHPLAEHGPILSLPQMFRDLIVSYTIQIVGNLVGVMFDPSSTHENELAIWDWTAGSMLLNIADSDLLTYSILSDPLILLGCADMDGGPALFALDFRKQSYGRHDLDGINAFVLEYPELAENAFLADIDIRSDPGSLSHPNSTVPFLQDAKQFLIVTSIWIVVDGVTKSLVHFIPFSHLLSLVESEDAPHALPSDGWISSKTRLLLPGLYPSDTWVCYVHGMKFVISEPHPSGKSGYSARLFNFNQLAFRNAKEAPTRVDTSATLLGEGESFCEDVTTCLPFWSQTIALDDCHEHCTVLCNEDHIIVVDVSFLYDRMRTIADLTRPKLEAGMRRVPSPGFLRVCTRCMLWRIDETAQRSDNRNVILDAGICAILDQ